MWSSRSSESATGLSAEIPHCSNLHIVDVPPATRSTDRIEIGGPRVALLRQLHLDDPVPAIAGRLAQNAVFLVIEVALKNHEPLLELFTIHVVARRSAARAEYHRHGLQILSAYSREKVLDR